MTITKTIESRAHVKVDSVLQIRLICRRRCTKLHKLESRSVLFVSSRVFLPIDFLLNRGSQHMSGMLFQQDGPRVLHLGFDVSKVVATGNGKSFSGGVSNPESAT